MATDLMCGEDTRTAGPYRRESADQMKVVRIRPPSSPLNTHGVGSRELMVVGNRSESVQTRNDPAFSDSPRSTKRESSERLLANIVCTVTPSCMDLVGIRGSRYTLQPLAAGKRPSVCQCSLVVKKEHAPSLAVCMTRHCLQACVAVLAADHPGIPIVKFSNERARCKWSGIHVIRHQLELVGRLDSMPCLSGVSGASSVCVHSFHETSFEDWKTSL